MLSLHASISVGYMPSMPSRIAKCVNVKLYRFIYFY